MRAGPFCAICQDIAGRATKAWCWPGT